MSNDEKGWEVTNPDGIFCLNFLTDSSRTFLSEFLVQQCLNQGGAGNDNVELTSIRRGEIADREGIWVLVVQANPPLPHRTV